MPAAAKSRSTKNKAKGVRRFVSFGAIKTKKNGKVVTSEAISRVQDSVVTLLGLKISTPKSQTLALKKNKAGAFYLPKRSGTKSATRSLRCTTGDGYWHSLPVPTGVSYSRAFLFLIKASKVVAVQTPAGAEYHKDSYTPKKSPTAKKTTAKK
jgi:hypothetical protein